MTPDQLIDVLQGANHGETPEEKARRKGVPLIPKQTPNKPLRSDSTVAVCGECGLEIKMTMGYYCSRTNCPAGLGGSYSLAAPEAAAKHGRAMCITGEG